MKPSDIFSFSFCFTRSIMVTMDSVKIWLDDVRTPPDQSWTWVKTYKDAITVLSFHKNQGRSIGQISFDNDLGYCKTCEDNDNISTKCTCSCHMEGYDVLNWIEANDYWPLQKPTVHSMNPVKSRLMKDVINRRYGENHGH